MTVTITHTGGQPPQIDVRRGADHWTVTPDHLATLPADVRPYVVRQLRYPAGTRLAAPDLARALR
jgi:hypothetical protein